MSGKLLGSIGKTMSVSSIVGDPDMTPEQADRVRTAQLKAVTELNNILAMASLLTVFVILILFADTSVSHLLAIWGVVMCVTMAYGLIKFIRSRGKEHSAGFSSEQAIKRYVQASTIIGTMWAIVPLIVIPLADDIGFATTGVLLTGTMFGGVLLIGRIPDAAMGFIMPIVVGILVGLQLQQDPRNNLLTIMILVYAGVLYFASRWAYVQFAQQHISTFALEDQTELIGLLLRDFEESTSDWLWQTDAEGRFIDLPNELIGTRNENEFLVEGQPILKLFERDGALQDLDSALNDHRPFKDLVLRLNGGDQDVWWSLTGKPLFEKGAFQGFRGVASDVTLSKISEDRIAYMAHFDTLTDLPNRISLINHLQSISASPANTRKGDAVLIWLDLDNFKWVNDTMGHHAGDELLRLVATRLKTVTERKTFVARISGDEFALVLNYADYSALIDGVEDIMGKLKQPYEIWGTSVQCHATLGVKVLPALGYDVELALKHAYLALYHAKEHEKGSWRMFDQRLDDMVRNDRELECDLNIAIERDQLQLFFQPLVNATSREIVGVETLIRWNHPRRGLLTPDSFIEFAEERGLITRMGDWVIRQALNEARSLPEHVRIAVNISPIQLHSTSLVPTIINALASNGIAANRLELEITESVMISDTEITLKRLQQLKDIGLRIALDDFGTGFSSLSYLRSFPFDKLKIDKSFTGDLETSEDSRAIIKAMLGLAKALGMSVTGEGVETPGQGDFLRDHGCDELQGYMISRPLPLEKLGHLIPLQAHTETGSPTSVVNIADAPKKPARNPRRASNG